MEKELELCEYTKEFLVLSYTWLADPYINKMFNCGIVNKDIQDKWFERLPQRTDTKVWGVRYGGKPIGACGFKNIQEDNVTYWTYIGDRSLHNKGLGKRILLLAEEQARLMNKAFIQCRVLVENTPSIEHFKKSGFSEFYRDERFLYFKKVL